MGTTPKGTMTAKELVGWFEESYQSLFSISRFWPCCAGEALRLDMDGNYVPLEQVGVGGYIGCQRDLDLWCYLANSWVVGPDMERAAQTALDARLDAGWVDAAAWAVADDIDDEMPAGVYDMADDITGDLGWVEFRLDDLAEDVPELFEERFYRLLEGRDPALAARARELGAQLG